MNPWEKLTEEDIKNIKMQGTGFLQFLLGVLVTLLILHFVYGVI